MTSWSSTCLPAVFTHAFCSKFHRTACFKLCFSSDPAMAAEKIQINNQIISMRKLVKQAKVHIINKLVKEVKILKEKKGDETKTAKYKRKAERLLLEINLIKKMNVDAVSKKALSSKENWKQMISDKSVSLDDRAMARLISFGPLHKEAQEFDSRFPDLAKMLPDLIQQWEAKKQDTSPRTKELKAAEIKQVKKERRLKKKKLQHTNHDISLTSNVKKNPKSPEKESDVPSSSDEPQECEETSLDEVQNSDLLSAHEKENKVEVSLSTENQEHRVRHVSPSVSNSDCSDKFNRSKKKHGDKIKKHYIKEKSVKRIDRPRKNPIVGGLSNRKYKKQGHSSHMKLTGANSEPCSVKSRTKLDSVSARTASPKFDDSRNQKNVVSPGPKNDPLKSAGKKAPIVSLHPSWEAKRKMNSQTNSILPFQGKKIIFDE